MSSNRTQGVAEPRRKLPNNLTIRRIRNISVVMLSLLFLQYLLGMAANLFVNFPAETPVRNPLDSVLTNGPYLVLFHILVGLALGLISITLVILSAIAKKRSLILISIGGLGSILLAGESGIEFVLGWYLNNLFSFLMSLGFILAFLVFFALFWSTSQRQV